MQRADIIANVRSLSMQELYTALSNIRGHKWDIPDPIEGVTYESLLMEEIDRREVLNAQYE